MELRELASFLAVVEEGQFARAAARLFLSPPAVTAHVQRLERDLGVRLLERSPLRLTGAGERFVPHARAALAAANAAVAAATAVAEPPGAGEQVLRVGVMGHGSAELTPAIVRAFRRARPDVRLEIGPLDFTEHVTALVENRVDVAFVRPAPDDERIAVDVLTTEPRIVCVPAEGPFGDAAALRLADVLDLPIARIPDVTPAVFADYLYFTRAVNGERGRRGPDVVRSPQDVLLSVAAGRGVGSALASFARFYPWPGVRYVPIVDAPWDCSVLATRRGDPGGPVRAFRALAGALARDVGPALLGRPPVPGESGQVVRGALSGIDSLEA
ncbi:LysR family transcriptional regulator [Actinomadura algeriensis]|uniref:DNA-binding transcriptional LysR family regulator n=1 Tax=Actinomadura algeriensis TaxID=1679523 RepID=A0ABR9JRA5_9ACTN|nr:LysR family transcriptional regulator [Actinomadura algeriensis]MBE1532949.1 DNA-binding transcriptional LysR family regulator [Actinomadura algeriensis]